MTDSVTPPRYVTLGDLVSFKTGKLDSNAAVSNGRYPFFTCSQQTLSTDTFAFDCECVLLAGNNATGTFPIKYFEGKFDAYQRTYVIQPLNQDVLDTRYLYYSLQLKLHVMKSLSTGAATKFLTLSILKKIEILLPSLVIQRKIVAILSPYDDLCENNNRRVKFLEEMAQRLYREWFVDFHYPGHERVPVVDSELGPIPRGWKPLPSSEALVVNPKVVVDRAAVRPFVPMTSLSEAGMHVYPIEQRVGTSGAKFQNGDTLFARITPCLENGKTAYVQCLADKEVASGSTEFIVLRSRELSPEYVYLLARSDAFRSHAIKSMSGTTGRQRVREECFDSFLVLVPPAGLLRSFEEQVRPLFHLSYTLFTANATLRSTLKLLMPRLLSGEIDVKDLDIVKREPVS